MIKGEATKKVGLKSSIWKRKIESQPLEPPKRGRSVGDLWGETSKGENNERIRKGPAINVVDTTLVLVPKVANGGNQWYTKNPRKAL